MSRVIYSVPQTLVVLDCLDEQHHLDWQGRCEAVILCREARG